MKKEAGSGVLGPVAPEVILAKADALDPGSAALLRTVEGARDHHAVASEDTDITWANEVAQALSQEHPGMFHAFAVHPDFYWLTSVEGGVVMFSDEGAIDPIATEVGVPLGLD